LTAAAPGAGATGVNATVIASVIAAVIVTVIAGATLAANRCNLLFPVIEF
jgi:hypothetical protein